VIEWIDFIGSGVFCLKMCNPNGPNAAQLCNHIYDVIGCTYNAVADYNSINGTFTVCDSEDMEPPGIYTVDGQVSTWVQPATQPFTPPYTPVLPSSSNCVTYSSQQLFAAAATDTAVATAASATATGAHGGSGNSGGSTGTRSGSGSNPSNTGSASAAPASFQVGAGSFVATVFMTSVVTMFAMLA
jgi:hypothetical protein